MYQKWVVRPVSDRKFSMAIEVAPSAVERFPKSEKRISVLSL